MIQNAHMKAVYDDDLVTLLQSLKVYDDITNGKIHCKYCQQQVTLENLGAIIPVDGQIAFSCDNAMCINRLAEEGAINES